MGLPEQELAAIAPLLKLREFELGDIIQEAGDEVRSIIFPVAGVVSILTAMRDGTSVEVAMASSDGFAPTSVLMGSPISNQRYISQVPVSAFTAEAFAFGAVLETTPVLQRRLNRYLHAQFAEVAQTGACNRLHSAEQRMARWLMEMAERLGTFEFPITQEFLSEMVGSRRPTVTLIAREMSDAGLISYRHGQLKIDDPEAVRKRACECLRIVLDTLAVDVDAVVRQTTATP